MLEQAEVQKNCCTKGFLIQPVSTDTWQQTFWGILSFHYKNKIYFWGYGEERVSITC